MISKIKALSSAIIFASVPTTSVFAAALDRSGQSISAFLQPGNYFEAGISVLDADVSGKIANDWKVTGHKKNNSLQGSNLGDMAESYQFYNAALKTQLNEHFSFGLIYDQPYGAKAKYSGADARHTSSDAVALKTQNAGAFTVGDEATEVSVDTQTLSLIFGFQPNENWNIYAGPVYQTVEGNVQLRGTAYGPYGGFLCTSIGTTDRCNKADSSLGKDHNYKGYKAQIKEDSSVGWLAGLAYQIPEIALKASLTYRSEIDHKTNINEELPVTVSATASAFPITAAFYETNRSSKVTTPQSVNLDLQSGIMENTIAFAQLRWVDWSSFEIRPHQFNQLSKVLYASKNVPSNFALVAYDKDQISANLGVARKFNEQWAGTLMVGWDSGAGNPVSTLGPTDGYWSAGLGGQFSPTPQTFIQAGVKYFWLGDAKSQVASDFGTDKYIANFNDNHAIGYSLKMGYRF